MLEDLISKPLEKISENPLGSALDLMLLASPEAKVASMLLPGASQLVDKLFGSATCDEGGIEITNIAGSLLKDLI